MGLRLAGGGGFVGGPRGGAVTWTHGRESGRPRRRPTGSVWRRGTPRPRRRRPPGRRGLRRRRHGLPLVAAGLGGLLPRLPERRQGQRRRVADPGRADASPPAG